MKKEKESRISFYNNNIKKATIKYKAFCQRINTGKYNTYLEALTMPSKGSEKKRIIKQKEIKIDKKTIFDQAPTLKIVIDNINQYYKDLRETYKQLNESFIISSRAFHDRIKKGIYTNKKERVILIRTKKGQFCNEPILKGETTKENKVIFIREKKEKKYIEKILKTLDYPEKQGITKKGFYSFFENTLGRMNIISYKTFTNRTLAKEYNPIVWKKALLYKKDEIQEFYTTQKKIIKESGLYKKYNVVGMNKFRTRIIHEKFPLKIDSLLCLKADKRKKRTKNTKKPDVPDIEEYFESENLLEFLSENELREKKFEIEKKFNRKNKKLVFLFKTRNFYTKKATIKGIYFILDKISSELYEIANIKGTEVLLVNPSWLKYFKPLQKNKG